MHALRPRLWPLALLAWTMACSAPNVEPVIPNFRREGPVRVYYVHPFVPTLVETRCRLDDQPLLRNPHFDRQAVRLQFVGGDPLPVHIQVLRTAVESRRYPVWLKVDGTPVESRHYSEEELGARTLAELEGLVSTGRISRSRRVDREFLSAQLLVMWSGILPSSAETTWRAFPALDAALTMTAATYTGPHVPEGALHLGLPWDVVCGHAWKSR